MSFYKSKLSKDNVDLVWQFFVDDKKCEHSEHYNNYLRFNALSDSREVLGVTYLYIDDNEKNGQKYIMGYITLRFSSYIKDMGEKKKYGYPALEIAELAVDKNYAGRHIGSDMVMDAINMAVELNEIVSVKYIVLCADPTAEEFYEKLEFTRMHENFEDVPREHYNLTCVPMYLKLC